MSAVLSQEETVELIRHIGEKQEPVWIQHGRKEYRVMSAVPAGAKLLCNCCGRLSDHTNDVQFVVVDERDLPQDDWPDDLDEMAMNGDCEVSEFDLGELDDID